MVPHNTEAEESLLGAMMMSPEALAIGLDLSESEDFYVPAHAAIFAAIRSLHARGEQVDTLTVADEWARFDPQGAQPTKPLELAVNVPRTSHAANYAKVVARHAASRRQIAMLAEASTTLQEMGDPYEVADALAANLATIDAPIDESRQEAMTIDDVVSTAEEVSPWAVEGLLRQDWRALLVAGEGQGKSVILRQIAMLAAQGIHPFKFNRTTPIRSLIVDLENPAASIAETGGKMVDRLRTLLGADYDPTRCRVFRRPGGIDPRTRHDRGELEREIMLQRPALVCIGPAYKMLHRRSGKGGNESHEEATDPVLAILDDLRTRYSFALMIEHHAPQGFGGSRDMRPYGSQRWLAWPEIGLSLKQDNENQSWTLGRFRGDRLISNWPTELRRGQVWPWEGTWRTNGGAF